MCIPRACTMHVLISLFWEYTNNFKNIVPLPLSSLFHLLIGCWILLEVLLRCVAILTSTVMEEEINALTRRLLFRCKDSQVVILRLHALGNTGSICHSQSRANFPKERPDSGLEAAVCQCAAGTWEAVSLCQCPAAG